VNNENITIGLFLLQNQAIPVSAHSPHNSARSAQNFANEKAGFLPLLVNNEFVSTSGLPNESLKQTIAIVLPNLIHRAKTRGFRG
jgi:hypothetical protein